MSISTLAQAVQAPGSFGSEAQNMTSLSVLGSGVRIQPGRFE